LKNINLRSSIIEIIMTIIIVVAMITITKIK